MFSFCAKSYYLNLKLYSLFFQYHSAKKHLYIKDTRQQKIIKTSDIATGIKNIEKRKKKKEKYRKIQTTIKNVFTFTLLQ